MSDGRYNGILGVAAALEVLRIMLLDVDLMRHTPRLSGQMKKALDFLNCGAFLQCGQEHRLFKLSILFKISKEQNEK